MNANNQQNGARDRSLGKWAHIKQLISENRIGILCLQETHLDDEREQAIQNLFARQLVIVKSANTENARGRGGVAIVLNKSLLRTNGLAAPTIIVPGRAILLRVKTHQEGETTILNVYAPTQSEENKQFWITLSEYFAAHPTKRPDMMVGDFNIVEDRIDRLPMRHGSDPEQAVDALDDLKRTLRMKDGWRNTFPERKAWTYYRQQHQDNMGSKSRIDRIYIVNKVLETALDWKITPCHLSDHHMVSV
ncbi:DNase I-like protein, partial [Agrocybe pediades]